MNADSLEKLNKLKMKNLQTVGQLMKMLRIHWILFSNIYW